MIRELRLGIIIWGLCLGNGNRDSDWDLELNVTAKYKLLDSLLGKNSFVFRLYVRILAYYRQRVNTGYRLHSHYC